MDKKYSVSKAGRPGRKSQFEFQHFKVVCFDDFVFCCLLHRQDKSVYVGVGGLKVAGPLLAPFSNRKSGVLPCQLPGAIFEQNKSRLKDMREIAVFCNLMFASVL